MWEKNVCRGECCKFGRELLHLSAHALTHEVRVEGGRCWLGQQGRKEMIDALGVEEGRKLGENLWCRKHEDRIETDSPADFGVAGVED